MHCVASPDVAEYDVDGGKDLDIFDINEGKSAGGSTGDSIFAAVLLKWFPLFFVFSAAGLNLVEGDIVLDEVRSSIHGL